MRFIAYRIKIACTKGRLVKPIYNSKTMAMHSIVNNVTECYISIYKNCVTAI